MASIEENRHPGLRSAAPDELPPMRYHEIGPAAALVSYVQCYAEFLVLEAPPRPYRHLVVPDGCPHLTYLRPAAPRGAVVLAGPRTQSVEHVITGPLLCWDVKLRPHGFGLLRRDAGEWLGRMEAPSGELSDLAHRMETGLGRCDTVDEAGSVLDALLLPFLESAPPIDELVAGVVARIEASNGSEPIGELAAGLTVGERQLQRRFRTATGITPKQFSRIRRFRACARNLIATRPEQWGRVAMAHGYADQAHLNREFARLSGRSPTQLERYIACIEYGDIEV